MTLVPRLVLSLRSSGNEGVLSTRGACVAWNGGLLGDRFTSVPLPKAWMVRASRPCRAFTHERKQEKRLEDAWHWGESTGTLARVRGEQLRDKAQH